MLRMLIVLGFCCLSFNASAIVGGARELSLINRPIVMVIGKRGNRAIFCTGTALSANLILTAAHCTESGTDLAIFVTIGQPRTNRIPIERIARHPRYNAHDYARQRVTADIALVKLAEPLPSNILPANFPGGDVIISAGDLLQIAGFGVTDAGSDAIDGIGRVATLLVTGRPGNLQIRLIDPVTQNERAGLGACIGDSGGPAFREIDGKHVIVGVVSWSTGPRDSEGCGGMTGLTPLGTNRQWIIEQAAKLGSPLVR